MKILTVSSCRLDPMLGSGKTRLRWSEGLRALGHTVDVLEPEHYEALRSVRRGTRFRQAVGALRVVTQRIAHGGYDLIDFCGGEFGLATWWLSRRADRPMLVAHTDGLELLAREREDSYEPATTPRARLARLFGAQTHDRLSRAAFTHADVFLTLCRLDRDYVVGHGLFPEDRAAVIPPGLDVEYLARPFVAIKERRVAYVGSWIPRKGVTVVTSVMSKVLAQEENLRFDIFGASGQRSAILSSFPEPVRGRVVVHPRMSNEALAAELSKSGIFFFPSQYEGFGMAVAEAMGCSCAVVTTPTGYGAELVDGREALLRAFDDVAGMERAILNLLGDEPKRSSIAKNGWERVRALDWTANIKTLEATYLRWLGQRRGRAAVPY